MHNPTKTYKQNNTLVRVFNKNHGLHYFNMYYQMGIAYGKEYSMNLWKAIPLCRYPKNALGSIMYLLTHGGVLCSTTKTSKETNTIIRVFNN
jgi:hypothetical protein